MTMDVTYNASSSAKQREVMSALRGKGYKVSEPQRRMAFPYPVRVWRVDEADEQAVIKAILDVDSEAEPVLPKPSYLHE